jgi:outer membrane protein TolC
MEPVPVSLPAALLDQRPDVIEAELKLAAGTERIGVSIAEMYPDLTLSAAGGYSASRFKMLTDPESQIWSSLISLAAPVFKGGRLKAGVAAAEARAAQARAAYAGVVLKALGEVEDALVSEKMLRQRLERLQRRLHQARKSEALGRQRYMDGLERLLVVLDTQRRRQIAQVELVHIKNELFNNRINLFLAIGGDWQIDLKQKQEGLN